MFSKSKRFLEAGKDYVPGPGEYQVAMDDAGRHKRYGFLTQTSRFSEGQDPFGPNEFYTNGSESTTTASVSISSTTSSNRTLDEPVVPRSSPRRASITRTETTNPFEKYRYAMQKEIGTLQTKTRKMESTIQTLETDKNTTKALLLDRDAELADLRSKNAMLQKTIQRQDKSTKTAQLQKKMEQLEETVQNSQIEHVKQLQEKEAMRLEIETHKQSVCDLHKVQQSSQEVHTLLEAQIQTLTFELSESQTNAAQQDIQITDLKHTVSHMTQSISSLEQQLETQNAESSNLKQSNHDLMTRLQAHQEVIQQLESRLALKDEEIDALLHTVDDRDCALQEKASTITHLDQKFNTYRDYMNATVVPHLRGQTKSTEQMHMKELNALLTELHDAKRFINKQAQSMDLLKSSVYWLNVQNTQLQTLIHCMYQEHKNQWAFNKKHLQYSITQGQQHDDDDAVVSSRSTVLDCQDDLPTRNIDSSKIVLNDSGFGILTEEFQ